MPTNTIAFIHGAFVTKACWDGWVERYRAKGFECVALAWPLRDRPVSELKAAHPDRELAKLTMPQVVAHLEKALVALPEKPIIIGHSFGGLLTQLMLQRGLGVAGVAIDSVPPQGVITTKWSFIRSLWPAITPFRSVSEPYYMSFAEFQYTFVHTLPLEEQRRAYDAHVVPESRRLARGGLSSAARVDFRKARPPLLMIAGERDHIMPASLNKSNYEKYARSPSVTGFKEFPGRVHHIIAERGWEEVADYALAWATQVTQAAAIGTQRGPS